MSGGHFDYKQYAIQNCADEVNTLIDNNDSTRKTKYGDDVGFHYPKEIIDKFVETAFCLKRASAMLQRVDWLVSGDDGEESFLQRWKEEIQYEQHIR